MIRFEKVTKSFLQDGAQVPVIQDIDFHLEEGEIVTILGRSGSGKSTLLDLIMGLTQPTSGTITRNRKSYSLGYVFQRPALLPWYTLARNVGMPLEIAGEPADIRRQAIQQALTQVGLQYAGNAYPFQLSGGMAQRAAIARALVQNPAMLLMDEPFSALDPILRENMNINLLGLYQRTQKTILFVTHSIDEAVILSNRILILEDGSFLHEFPIDLPRPRGYHTFQTRPFSQYVRLIREHLPIQPNLAQNQTTADV